MLADELPAQWSYWSAARRNAYKTELAKAYHVEIAPPVPNPPKPSPSRKKVRRTLSTNPLQPRLTSSTPMCIPVAHSHRIWQGASAALIEEISDFYQQHAPGKLQDGSVDKLLKKFKGREKTLLTNIKSKYVNQEVQLVAGTAAATGTQCSAHSQGPCVRVLFSACWTGH